MDRGSFRNGLCTVITNRRKVERTGASLDLNSRAQFSSSILDLNSRAQYVELNTWSLKLSQYEHFTEVCTKQTLNERWHVLGDGCGVVQRDLYAAFLAFTVVKDENDQPSIHPSFTAEVWPKFGRSLAEVWPKSGRLRNRYGAVRDG
jgi:hypothetical protein